MAEVGLKKHPPSPKLAKGGGGGLCTRPVTLPARMQGCAAKKASALTGATCQAQICGMVLPQNGPQDPIQAQASETQTKTKKR